MAKVKIAFTGDTSQLKKSVKDAKKQIKGISTNLPSISIGKIMGIGAAIGSVMALRSAIRGIGSQIVQSSKEAMSFETLGIQLEVLTGNARTAARLLEEITKYGATTPLEQGPLQQSTKSLLQFGVAADEVMDVLKMLGDISMGDGEKLTRLAVIFGKVSSAGKMNAEDLNQLIDAGYNPSITMAEQLGISVSELRKQMSKGAIGIDMLKGAMTSATSKGGQFHNMLSKISQSTGGKLSNLSDTITQLQIAFGTGFNVGLGQMIDQLNNILPNFEANARNLGKAAGDLIAALSQHLPKLIDDFTQSINSEGGIWGALKEGILNILNDPTIKDAVKTLGELLLPEWIRSSAVGQIADTQISGASQLGTGATILGIMTGVKQLTGAGLLITGLNSANAKTSKGETPSIADTAHIIGGLLFSSKTTLTTLIGGLKTFGKPLTTLLGRTATLGSQAKLLANPYVLAAAVGYGGGYAGGRYGMEWLDDRNQPTVNNEFKEKLADVYRDESTARRKLVDDMKALDISKWNKKLDDAWATWESNRDAVTKEKANAELKKTEALVSTVRELMTSSNHMGDGILENDTNLRRMRKGTTEFFKPLDMAKPFLDSLQSIGGGKIFGGVDVASIAREQLMVLKSIDRKSGLATYAVAA